MLLLDFRHFRAAQVCGPLIDAAEPLRVSAET
jgi:hypothetical protein